MSKLFQKYDALLKGDRPWQKSDIAGLKSQLGGWKNNSSLTPGQVANLRDRSAYSHHYDSDEAVDRCFRITEEQRQVGIEWLLAKAFRKDGLPRQDKHIGVELTNHARSVILGFQRFEFVGFYELDYRYGRYYLQPVYRCHGVGGYFDYYFNRDWGGLNAFEILKEVVLAPELAPCSGCINLHGVSYGGTMLVCGFQPYGWEDAHCPDKTFG